MEEKDPLALDDDTVEDVDPYDHNSDDQPIIPIINPDVDKDLAADEDDGDPPLEMGNFLQAQVLST